MPESVDVVVSVPYSDRDELTALIRGVDQSSPALESRSLDGVTIATAVVTVATATLAALKEWLSARLEARKGCVVSFEGVSLQGYSAEEVERIVGVLNRELGSVGEGSSDDA